MPPNIPYIISITVYDSDNSAAEGEQVKVINESTGDVMIVPGTTNGSGQILADLANFPNGYSDGQYIQVQVIGASNAGQELAFKAKNYGNYVQIEKLDIKYEL